MRAENGGFSVNTDQVILLVLFVFALDVLDMSGILIALSIVLYFFLHWTELEFDTSAGMLVVFSAFYFGSVAYYEGMATDVIIKYALAPWGSYLLSYTLLRQNREIRVTAFSMMLACGFFLHGMLNLYSSIQVYGASFVNNYRQAFDFWQHREITVTTASLYYSPFTMMSMGAVFFSHSKLIKGLCAVSVMMAMYASMIYQNRTLIFSVGLIAGLSVLLVLIDRDITLEKKYQICGILAVLVLCVVIAFLANVAGIRDTIMNSSLMNRMTGDKQDRTTIWLSFIFGEAWKYPFGGTKAVLYANKPYVHNTWLDSFRRGGFVPFVTLCLFTLRSFFDVLTFCRLGRLTGEETGILVALLCGIMLSFMVEPVIEANPYVFYLPIFVMGAINGHNRRTEELLAQYASYQ